MKITILFFGLFCYSRIFAKLDTEWWKHTIIYEIIPYSYKDSDGDGIGDLKGITSKLDHMEDLGIESIHLTPIFETTFRDIGYDIKDYYKIESKLGNMDDFDELVREMKKRNMKLLLDLVINHSSHKHEWFQKSIDRIDPYTDFYVWKESKGFDNETQKEIPPNKWHSIFASSDPGSAWTWNEKRKQFYYHQFLEEQPDFNLYNEILKQELKKMIKFWLDKGIAGFRMDATPNYFEDKLFRDDLGYARQSNQPETIEFIHEFRLFLDEYSAENGGFERIFVAEAHADVPTLIQYYGRNDYRVTHFPFNFILKYQQGPIMDARDLEMYMYYWMGVLPEGAISAWMTQDHDGDRVGSRIVPEYNDIFTMLSMMLPGTVGIYYGQEIAMLNGFIHKDQIKDFSGKGSRDPGRLVMQWDDTINSGFSSNTTNIYLPFSSDYFERNVEIEKLKKNSHYNMFKDLSLLRKTDTFKLGKFENDALSEHIYTMTRSYENDALTLVINFDTLLSRVNLTETLKNPPNPVTVAAASVNAGYSKGFVVDKQSLDEFSMRPLSCLVLQYGIIKNQNISENKE